MAFRREVPALDKMVLKFISKAPRQLGVILNEKTLARAHRIGKPAKSRTHRAKQEVIRALLRGGRLGDDTLPAGFFHASMTRVEIIGAKISTVFVQMLAQTCPKLEHLRKHSPKLQVLQSIGLNGVEEAQLTRRADYVYVVVAAEH
jgi:hypothetical protein